MPTYYVEDYDGKRNEDAVEPLTLNPVVDDAPQVRAKVVESEAKRPAKKTAAARTKSGGQ